MIEKDYEIRDARYSKGNKAVKPFNKTDFKARAARLADSISNGRYSHREGSYIMSPRKAQKFEDLYNKGWDASAITGELRPPKENN